MKVLISTSSFAIFDQKPLKMLEEAGLNIQLNPYGRKLTKDEIRGLLQDVQLLVAGTEPLTGDVLRSAKDLKVISRCGVGMDNVDLEEAKKLGIKVFNTPFGPTQAVAELTLCLILNLLRRVSQVDRNLRKGVWQKEMGNLLSGKKVGIIGCGRIGQKVAELLLVLGAEVIYYDVCQIDTSLSIKPSELKKLLASSDIVTIHMSVAKGEKPIIGEEELKLMKPEAYLVNMARGGVVDEETLCRALEDKKIKGAALDVFVQEPYEGPLVKCENVILTPHIGSYAQEARIAMEMQAVENLLKNI